MAEQTEAAGDVLDAIERRDWALLRSLLDPAVHWTAAAEDQLQARTP